jgi:hypothetical protein
LTVIVRLAGGAVAAAVVAGYLALGAAVLVGRGILEVVQHTGGLLRSGGGEEGGESRDAA